MDISIKTKINDVRCKKTNGKSKCYLENAGYTGTSGLATSTRTARNYIFTIFQIEGEEIINA